MVKRTNALRAVLALIPLLLFVFVLLAGACHAADDQKPTMNEEYQVTINDIGDGHVVGTIKYSKDDFAAVKKVADKKRGFLTRRFTTDDNTGEVVHFKTDIDNTKKAVVITYDKPGYAYNEKGQFVIYGFSQEPKKGGGGNFTYEEKSMTNSKFTLFTDQVILTKTTIQLPGVAREANYDSGDKAIKYQMPAARAQLGLWSDNKLELSIVFGLCTLLFAGLLVYTATRKAVAAPGPPAVAPVTPPASAAPPVPDRPAAVEPPVALTPPPAVEPTTGPDCGKEESPKFCRKCGHPLAPGRRFCTNCGEHA